MFLRWIWKPWIESWWMANPVILNASPLIFLARSGQLGLLKILQAPIWIPKPVADEVPFRGGQDPTAQALAKKSWLEIVEVSSIPHRILAWDLGPGESSVLALALSQPGAEVMIDDLAGRRCAQAMNIPLRGTLGLVLLAKKRGAIPEARTVLKQMRQHGMYLSDAVLNAALQRVDEYWP